MGAHRLITACVLAVAMSSVAGCGGIGPTTGKVAGSEKRPHLGVKEFAPTVTRAMADASSVHVAIRAEAGAKKSQMDADISFARTGSIQLTMSDAIGMFGQPFSDERELRLVNGRMYVSQSEGKVRKFRAYDVRDGRSPLGRLAAQVRSQSEPEQSMEPIRKGLRKLDYLGLVAQDGLYLDHYRAVVDTAAVQAAGAKTSEAAGTVTLDVWLDSDHRLHEMSYETDAMSMTTSYSGWEQRVDVEVPGPKDLVASSRT